MYATYVEDVTVKELPGYRFSPPSSVFANLTVNPDNAGFCVPEGNCLGSGVLNVSACKQGECGPPVLYRVQGPGPGAERRLNGALPPQLKHYAPLVFFSIFSSQTICPIRHSHPMVESERLIHTTLCKHDNSKLHIFWADLLGRVIQSYVNHKGFTEHLIRISESQLL